MVVGMLLADRMMMMMMTMANTSDFAFLSRSNSRQSRPYLHLVPFHLQQLPPINRSISCCEQSRAPFPIPCPRKLRIKTNTSHCSRGTMPEVPHPCTKMVPSDCLRPDFLPLVAL